MESYILRGGKHPSLPLEAAPRDAYRYIEPYLSSRTDKYQVSMKIACYKKAWRMPPNAQLSTGGGRLAMMS